MTAQEAIKDIKETINPVVGGKSLDMAIEALEKQISKKVEVWADGSEHCPCCDKNNSGLCFPVCIECGQKLDWGEQNERT